MNQQQMNGLSKIFWGLEWYLYKLSVATSLDKDALEDIEGMLKHCEESISLSLLELERLEGVDVSL